MAELTGWPTDGAEGSVSSEARWRKMARLWAPSGVATGLVPTLGSGVINVTAGSAWVDGHYCELVSPASESSTANGLLVVRFTPADNEFELVYRDGATTPTQSDATWELPIARMTAGAMSDVRSLVTPGGLSIAKGRAQAFPDNTIATAETVELTATINIPSDWHTYDIEAICQTDVFEIGSLTAVRVVTLRLRMGGLAGATMGISNVEIDPADPNRWPVTLAGYVTGISPDSPQQLVVFTTAIPGDTGQAATGQTTLIATAFRTT